MGMRMVQDEGGIGLEGKETPDLLLATNWNYLTDADDDDDFDGNDHDDWCDDDDDANDKDDFDPCDDWFVDHD